MFGNLKHVDARGKITRPCQACMNAAASSRKKDSAGTGTFWAEKRMPPHFRRV